MQEILMKAGLTADILKDAKKRALAIDEANAKAGGLRALMAGGKLTPAVTHPIEPKVSPREVVRYLQYTAAGKRIPIIFAAGRATRLKLPAVFDRLGIAGLTPRILKHIDSLREGEDAPMARLEADAELKALVDRTSRGEGRGPQDMSFLMRQILQYRHEAEQLIAAHPEAGVSFRDWLHHAKFAVVANEENKSAAAMQLASMGFVGLDPKHIFILVQPEEGGFEVLPDGRLAAFDAQRWPEGHGKPFIDMQEDPRAAFGVNDRGELRPLGQTFVRHLGSLGVERAVFAQVNDLHLLEDMSHTARFAAADALIHDGAEMVMEMVANGLRQKGGGIFRAPDGNTVMRDTIAMKAADLEAYSVPQSLSRMFYELTLSGIAKLTPRTLPGYLNERKTSQGKTVLTVEYYSGDASSVLRARAIQQAGYDLDTFKMQSRIPHALEALARQDAQPGYFGPFRKPL